VQELRNLFTDARAWSKARTASPETQRYDIRFASMQPVLAGKVPLIVAADEAEEIQAAVAFGVEQKLQVIIFGGYDAESCAELLRRYQVPVIVSAVHRDPRNDHDDYDAAYTLPERLRKAGIRFCISGSARSETWNTRNLPYQAATAAAYGLPRDEALKSVTLYPAQILGVADRLGSLEPGRDATIFVSTGDPLETDSQVTQAWIQGRVVDLNSRHTQLAGKYGEKFRRLNEGR
jgi:imidazolonepropionase-like amidohydrolase